MGCLKLQNIDTEAIGTFDQNLKVVYSKTPTCQKNSVNYFPYGKVLREYSGTDEERYLTTQHERDRNTGLDYRGARYYDSDIGRFLSLDPLAAKFPEWNAYNYVLGNPVVFVDPDGKAPEWIPIEKNGTIVLKPEQGDNAASLASFLHVGKETATMLYNSRCSDGTVELSGVVENINIIENAIQDTKENPDNYDGYFDRNYDCHESSISLANSEYINYDNVVEGWELSKELRKDGGRKYTDVTDSPSKYRFAETLIRLGNSAGNTTHSATYLGTSKDGTIYTWSKNGNSSKPSIQTLESLVKLYSSMVQGISEESGGGFYNANY